MLFLLKFRVFFAEAVYAPSSVKKALFACKKGMASGADFNMDIFSPRGENLLLVAAGASDCGVVNLGMNIFFHWKPRQVGYKCY